MRAPVLHVAPFLWSGAGAVITRLCEAQRRRGPVAIVTTGHAAGERDWPRYRRRLRDAGVRHHRIDFFHRGPDTLGPSVERLAALLTDLEPGVVHAHAGVPSVGAVLARALSGSSARVIGQMYSWNPTRPAWMNRQDAWGFGETDKVVCSARAYWDKLVDLGVPPRRMVYVPWGLPLDALPYRPDGPDPARPVVGFVGRIEPRKEQLALVRAFARVHHAMPSARLELVGPVADETYGRAVRTAIRAHRLERAVRLSGEVRDVAAHLRRWHAFVSLSADEGQGLAILEAMAVGVPVLARPVAGVADFLSDGRTGIALPSVRSTHVAAAIRRVLADPGALAPMARRARRMVERRYDWTRTLTTFERLYWR